ncbi:MAG: YkgJ family cysteine cluster protein [Bryobacteraceae bacterium]|nr:YkgJ family cysteine cluster protein [Bryobacteraceae bacterium]
MLKFVEALRFTCLPGCTRCCRVQGWVYLTETDLRRAAAHLGMSPREFEERYVYRTRHLLRLRKPRGAQCHFLAEDGCRLHPEKPTQCRIYPFWPELTGSPSAWRNEGRTCPGIGQGELVPVQAVLRLSAEMQESYPEMYPVPRQRSVPRRTRLAMVK